MKKTVLNFALLLLFSSIFLVSCKKDKKDTPQPPATTPSNGTLIFHIHTMSDTNEIVAYDATQTLLSPDGRSYTISLAQLYLSSIVLIKSDNSELKVDSKYILLTPDEETYEVSASIPKGDYKGFRFVAGVDSTGNEGQLNHATAYPSGHPLNIADHSDMYWSWNSGYIFVKFEGMVDTSATKTGPADFPFYFHMGKAQSRRTVDFSSKAFTVTGGNSTYVHIMADYNKLLTGINDPISWSTMTNDPSIDAQVADNFGMMFEVE